MFSKKKIVRKITVITFINHFGKNEKNYVYYNNQNKKKSSSIMELLTYENIFCFETCPNYNHQIFGSEPNTSLPIWCRYKLLEHYAKGYHNNCYLKNNNNNNRIWNTHKKEIKFSKIEHLSSYVRLDSNT